MVRGIDTAASAMVGITALNDILANNLANINTPGFKQSNVTFKSIQDVVLKRSDSSNSGNNNTPAVGTISLGSVVDSNAVDFRQGGIKSTSNPLDLAIDGKGFFEIKTPNGTAYTRNGSFKRLSNGEIATNEGYILQGNNGPIKLENKDLQKLMVNSDGTIEYEGEVINKVKVVEFKNVYDLQPVGNSIFKLNNSQNKPELAKHFELTQKALENSNSNVVETMVNSITGMRTYDSLAKVIETNKNTLGKAVNEVGRLR
jgi:flagellar basal-body rod protein FlgG